MSPDHITDIIRQVLAVTLQISSPMLVVAMVVGFGIALFQSITQINEMTLTFVPKVFVFSAVIAVFFPWMLKVMIKLTHNLIIFQWDQLIELSNYAN
jgi:flagellar biosynthesis protein FliQ